MSESPVWLSILGDFSTTVLVIVTGVYVWLTNRLVRVGREQNLVVREQNAIQQAQLEEIRTQTALAYEPKVLLRPSKGGVQKTWPKHLTFRNFNPYPMEVQYVAFNFNGHDNRRLYEKWMIDALLPLGGTILEPFSSFEVPLPRSLDMEQPTVLVSFYYGGTGSQRYEYKARVSLIDGRVSAEKLVAAQGDNPFAFV